MTTEANNAAPTYYETIKAIETKMAETLNLAIGVKIQIVNRGRDAWTITSFYKGDATRAAEFLKKNLDFTQDGPAEEFEGETFIYLHGMDVTLAH